MLRQRKRQGEKAQVFLEYALVVGTIILIMLAMSTLIKRGSQSMIKTVADQIGNQVNAEQKFDESGHLVESYTSARTTTIKDKGEIAGDITYSQSDFTTTETDSYINLGFTNGN